MRKNRHMFMVFLPILLFSTSTFYAESKKEYRVGAFFAVTGKYASLLGEPEKNTVKMIEKQVNDAGGINGHKLVVFVGDTKGNNTRAVNAVKQLIEKNNVCALVGPSRSGSSMAALQEAQKANIPMISCAASERIVKPASERKWIFKTPQKDSDAVRRIYDHMVSKGITDIGIITGTTGFGNAGRNQLKLIAPEYGIKIVSDETYGPADTDMTAQLIKIKNSGAQSVVNWSIVPAQSIVPKNMKQLKMDIQLYQSHGFGNVKYAEAAGSAGEGIIFPAGRLLAVDTLADGHPQKALITKYKTEYEKEFKDNVSTFGGHAYDALWLVINALKAVGDDPAKIRDYIETCEFVGTGGTFKFSPEDHSGLDKYAFEMIIIKDGKFVVLRD